MVKTETGAEEDLKESRRARLLGARVSGLPIGGWIAVTIAVLAVVVGAGSWWTYGRGGRVPPVQGYFAGKQVWFIHTEASDEAVANKLTGMKRSPVVLVPELAKVPQEALASVYVFTNGVRGGGPFGFQPDVFDAAPGDPAYSPLKALNLVTWKQDAQARVLTSSDAVERAQSKGEVSIKRPGVVINMPLLRWPGGHR